MTDSEGAEVPTITRSDRDPTETRDRFAAWLSHTLGPAADAVVTDLEIPSANGMSSETLLVDAAWSEGGRRAERRLVARVEPPATAVPVFPSYDLDRQYEVMRLVGELSDGELPKRFRTARLNVAGAPGTLVCGTGYTGEDGVELLIAPGYAPQVWDALIDAGASPAGLGARDTLRLEVCFHLYGNDLMEERGPIEAGLGWCCKEDTGFIGSEAVRAAREGGTSEKLVPFAMTGPGIARQGNPVIGGGEVTSGTMSPCLGIGIGMAYVPADKTEPGTPIEIDVRGKPRQAEVREKPLYSKER